MRLYDMPGQRVQSIVGEAEAVRYEQQLSMVDLSNGVYFLHLRAETRSQAQKLTVVR